MNSSDIVQGDSVAAVLDSALDAGGGLLRLTPTWVPRSFLHPGRRIKLHPDDLYAYGADRGGIDERWFASTTEAANEGRVWHEGLSFCSFQGQALHFARTRLPKRGDALIGKSDVRPVSSGGRSTPSSSTTWGRFPHHMHQSFEQRQTDRPGRQARELLLPAAIQQLSTTTSATRSWGLSRGPPRTDVRRCLENWNKGDNGILDLSKAYRLKRGHGLADPAV